ARLTYAESALLAAALPSPRRFKVDAPSAYVRERQAWILRQMDRLGAGYLHAVRLAARDALRRPGTPRGCAVECAAKRAGGKRFPPLFCERTGFEPVRLAGLADRKSLATSVTRPRRRQRLSGHLDRGARSIRWRGRFQHRDHRLSGNSDRPVV